MSRNIVINSWIEEFAHFIANESYKLVKTCAKPKGVDVSKTLASKFLQYYIELMVYDSLSEYASQGMPAEQSYNYTKQNYLNSKLDIQNEISKGFEKAFKKFAGKNIEYYCQINPIPEPANKEPC